MCIQTVGILSQHLVLFLAAFCLHLGGRITIYATVLDSYWKGPWTRGQVGNHSTLQHTDFWETRTGSTLWNSLDSRFQFHREEKQEANSDCRLLVWNKGESLQKNSCRNNLEAPLGRDLHFPLLWKKNRWKMHKKKLRHEKACAPHHIIHLFFLGMQSYNIHVGKSAIPTTVSAFPIWKFMKCMMEVVRSS